jgi:enamine deaminase RidA (YjgF/YER057c/UK114 family)
MDRDLALPDDEAGRAARSAVGVAMPPLGLAVEVEAVVEVSD